ETGGTVRMRVALKEWAVVCEALAQGRQIVLLRKGGIAEPEKRFHLDQRRFWLFPTYFHQQRSAIKAAAAPLLQAAEEQRPQDGMIHIQHFAEIVGAYQLHDIVGVLRLRDFHVLSDETVHARFSYRTPGLRALVLRVYRAPAVRQLQDAKNYAG